VELSAKMSCYGCLHTVAMTLGDEGCAISRMRDWDCQHSVSTILPEFSPVVGPVFGRPNLLLHLQQKLLGSDVDKIIVLCCKKIDALTDGCIALEATFQQMCIYNCTVFTIVM
jgi:hypothetical protein